MADKLKRCPFCGGEATLVIDLAQTKDPVYCFECEDCGVLVYMDDLNDKDKSIKAWNNRHSPWHTGTPTEEGNYWVWCELIEDNCLPKSKRPYVGYWKDNEWWVNYPFTTIHSVLGADIVAWQKIEPYKEKEDGIQTGL